MSLRVSMAVKVVLAMYLPYWQCHRNPDTTVFVSVLGEFLLQFPKQRGETQLEKGKEINGKSMRPIFFYKKKGSVPVAASSARTQPSRGRKGAPTPPAAASGKQREREAAAAAVAGIISC